MYRLKTAVGTIMFLLSSFYLINTANAQTKGMIIEPATGAGKTVLDPNSDGYVSSSTAGFTSEDKVSS